jgi:hypothetical protein
MSWIKRNLYFFIGSLVALVLMGMAGWFLYSKWDANNQIVGQLNDDYEKLRRLNSQNPHPGNKTVDNIQAAKDEQKQLESFMQQARSHFKRIPRIPSPDEVPKLSDRDFSTALSLTIHQLQRDATNASVNLPDNYSFSFTAQNNSISFAPGSLEPLAIQLGEIKVICDVLFAAKINTLEQIRRERVSADDSKGPQTEYVSEKSVTNELAVITPYELSFRCFSSELAAVLNGFASSPAALVVKTINVEPAPAVTTTEQNMPMPMTSYAPAPSYTPAANPAIGAAAERARMMQRYGLGPGGRTGDRYSRGAARPEPTTPPPQYYAPPVAQPAAAGKGGLPTVLDEKQLKVTMALAVMKTLPAK